MQLVEYLDPEKTLIVFDKYKLNISQKNKNGTSRWRCETCKSMSITIDNKPRYVIRAPKSDLKHDETRCEKLLVD